MPIEQPIFVTGATGFIGTQLLQTLAENHFSGFALTHQAHLKTKNSHFKEVQGDLSFEFLSEFIKTNKPKFIFHLAGITNPNHPDLFLVNVDYLGNLIRAVETHSPDSVIIFMSTAAVYGEGANLAPFNEENELNPINTYGKCKKAAELLLENFATKGGKHYIARAFNVIGKHQSENFLMPTLCKKIVALEKKSGLQILSVRDPESIRDFLDVRDLTNGLVQMILKKAPFGVYNFSSGKGVSIQKTTEIALNLINSKNITVEYTQSEVNPSAIKTSVGSNLKALNSFGWKLQYTLQDSISEILSHFRQ